MNLAIAVLALFLQAAPSPPSTEPALSTAERRAIQADEDQKKEQLAAAEQARQKYMQAQQDEVQIEQDFARAHAGWHINPMSLTIEKDQVPSVKKP